MVKLIWEMVVKVFLVVEFFEVLLWKRNGDFLRDGLVYRVF